MRERQRWPKCGSINWQLTASCFPAFLESAKTDCRRKCTAFTEEQLKILTAAFDQKPYPGFATRQKLALEFGMLVQVSHRLCQEAKWHRTRYSMVQLWVLKQPFLSHPYPELGSQQQLAQELSVPEISIQVNGAE
ncbi:double homeobox protein A [Cavia porcellus]|uniref:double homeobox protein A n=1 Tax=Cavia porcellus TaxID=10141 RepID=UPI002FDF3151